MAESGARYRAQGGRDVKNQNNEESHRKDGKA